MYVLIHGFGTVYPISSVSPQLILRLSKIYSIDIPVHSEFVYISRTPPTPIQELFFDHEQFVYLDPCRWLLTLGVVHSCGQWLGASLQLELF